MKKRQEERLLKLWKARQEAEGHDVSRVTNLKEADEYFDKPKAQAKPKTQAKPKAQAKRKDAKKAEEA